MADVEKLSDGVVMNGTNQFDNEQTSLKSRTTEIAAEQIHIAVNGIDNSGASSIQEQPPMMNGDGGGAHIEGASQEKVITPDSATPSKAISNDTAPAAQENCHSSEPTVEVVEEAAVDVEQQAAQVEEPVVEVPETEPAPPSAVDDKALDEHDLDAVLPSDKLFTWHKDQPVKLRMGEAENGEKPVSLVSVFRRTVKRCPNRVALAVKRDGDWVKWTYRDYLASVRRTAKAFIKIGLEPYNAVGIIGFNCPEWFFSAIGAIWAGGFACGIYTSNTPEACQFVAGNCNANIIVVENDIQLQKILKVEDQLPDLKAIVQYNGEPSVKRDNIYSWNDLMKIGDQVPDSDLNERLKLIAPNKCCTLIYTSGTTGNPKGVMVSHDNITWTAARCMKAVGLQMDTDSLISYLPLSHIAAQLMDIHAPILAGVSVYFAQPDALKGSLGTTLKEVRPSIFLGVPRVWEKMEEKLKALGAQNTGLKKKIGAWAKSKGYQANVARMNKRSTPFGYSIANKLVFQKVKAGLGLDRARLCFTSAAPIMKETVEYFMSLDIPLFEIYGMSECTGPHTCCTPDNWRICTVGKEIPGMSTVLAPVEGEEIEGNGEICMQGRHVFMGYLNNEAKTVEALDEQGLLHSGDIGKYDKDGFLHITGRIKELIITAGGENVPPVYIEENVKMELPCVSNCMLVGDKRKFLSLLISIKTEVDPNTNAPRDQFTAGALDWCQSIGTKSSCVTDVLDNRDPVFLKAIQAGIDKANKNAVSNAQRIAKWSIIPKDFSVYGGELGPTLKLKRPVVHKQYKDTIEAFYA